MLWDGTTGTSGTAAMDILSRVPQDGYPRLLRGFSFPVSRDGASVQFYISTVIRLGKIYQNINFVVELSDRGSSQEE